MEKSKLSFVELIEQYWSEIYANSPKIILAVIFFVLFLLVGFLFKKITRKVIERKIEDRLLSRFFGKVIVWFFGIIGFAVSLNTAGLGGVAGSVIAGAGVGAFIIGFAFKDLGENFLSGIMLAFSRPFQVGDLVETNGVQGKVVSLDLRNTHIKSSDGKDIYIPNSSVVKNNLINYTIDGFLRQEIDLGVDYGSNFESCISFIQEEIKSISGVLVSDDKKPNIVIKDLGASSLNFKVIYWIDMFDSKYSAAEIKKQATFKILARLNTEGVGMPGDIVELKNYNEKFSVSNN